MSHLGTTRNPMSEARRQHIHGTLDTGAPPRGEGRYLLALLVFIALVGTLAAAALP